MFENKLVWRTDDVPLLGVHGGKRVNLYANAFEPGKFPWSGWQADWTTAPDSATCKGWTSSNASLNASFAGETLMPAATEQCGSTGDLLCVEQ